MWTLSKNDWLSCDLHYATSESLPNLVAYSDWELEPETPKSLSTKCEVHNMHTIFRSHTLLISVAAFEKSVYNSNEIRVVIYEGSGKEMLGVRLQ